MLGATQRHLGCARRMNESCIETPRVFACAGEQLLGIHCAPVLDARDIAVLIVVGGPQVRAGSHRQFTLLARALAGAGFASLRFDYRGMGDSGGEFRNFEAVDLDLRAATDELLHRASGCRGVVIWGLCDAACAALYYAPTDSRVLGLTLLNPWVHSSATSAAVRFKHYYLSRLLQASFWRKLWAGQIRVRDSAREVRAAAQSAARPSLAATELAPANPRHGSAGYLERMRRALVAFERPLAIICSGNDLTAREFLALQRRDPQWRRALQRSNITQTMIASANHTFASAAWRAQVEQQTCRWLSTL